LNKASSCELSIKPVLLSRHSQITTSRNMPADKLTYIEVFMLEMDVIGSKNA
jgi:hypothetical protein